ncbi:MAG: tetratricopeptide repeat protein [Cyanobacteriota bacterium]|nr:tetratricopeptide repeat protein [Cyanobacteriota bacterium]
MLKTSIDTAIEYHKAGNLDRAESIYREILQENPQNPEALHWLGAVAYQQGDYDRAISSIDRAITLNPDNPVFHNTAGMAYRARGERIAAIESYTRALSLDPTNPDIAGNLSRAVGEWYAVEGEAAIARLESASRICHESGNLVGAKVLCDRILQHQPDSVTALYRLGTIAYQEGQFDRAIEYLSRAADLAPDKPNIRNNLGAAYLAANQLELASSAYREALKLKSDFQPILESFQEVLQKLLVANPEAGKRELLLAARLFHFQDNLPLAKKFYQEVIKRDNRYVEAYHGLGVLLNQQGNPRQGIECLQRAIALRPDDYHSHNNLGLVYYDNNQPDKALESYRRALELQPGHGAILTNLKRAIDFLHVYYQETAQFYFNAGNLEQAAQVDFTAGNFFQEKTGNLEVARRYYRQAIETNPHHAEAHHAFGEASIKLKQFDVAIAACERAIQLRPNFALAYKTLGNAFLASQNSEAALKAYAQAITHQPNFAEAYSNAAGVYFLQGNLEKAIAIYQKALSFDSTKPEIYWNFGKVFERQGKLKENIQCWQQALGLNPTYAGALGRYQLGCKFLATGERDAAAAQFEKAIEIQPDYTDAHWDLCELLNMQNLAKSRQAGERFCRHVTDPKQLLAPLAMMKSFLSSGVTDVALKKWQELESKLATYLPQLNWRDVVRSYLNIVFDLPHLRDDPAANGKICRLLSQRYIAFLEHKEKAEKFQPPQHIISQVRSPLRIGFVSQHFRRHSVGWLSVDILEHLSRITPEIYLYITGEMKADELTERFDKLSAKLYRPPSLNVATLSQEIAGDNLDILVDLDSITVMLNVELLHRQLAPVNVSWLGFDAPYISPKNYYLGDRYTHPQGIDEHYLERIARLPNSFTAVASLPVSNFDRASLRRSLRIAPNQIVYLCVATGNKYCAEMVAAQISILKQVPDSVLLYKARVGDLQAIGEIYRAECRRQGVRINRVNRLPRTRTEEEHRLIYQFADILLDSYPYSGSTHVVEALWCNMPVVAKVARQSFGRQAYSLMQNAGTDMGISHTWEEYIDWAVRLGNDGNLRGMMRSQLERAKQPEHLAPLWNPQQFARDMYGIFQDLLAKQAISPAMPTFVQM